MPTKDEYTALGNAVNTALTADYQGSGVGGMICTDKTDSSKVLFFPAAGYCIGNSVLNVGGYGYYWSSSLRSGNVKSAYLLNFYSGSVNLVINDYRYGGYPVRGVVD